MENQNNLITTAPTGSTSHSDRQQAAILVNKIFNGLKAIFPAWAAAIKDQDYQNQVKAEWLKGLIENAITADYQIEAGFTKARAHNSPFLPSIGQFVAWCKEATEHQWPPLEACYAELMQFIARNRKDTYNLPQFLYHTVTRNLDLYTFKQLEREYDRQKAFDVAYKATLFQLETGHELASPPAPETLIEDKSGYTPPTETQIAKASAALSDILAGFDKPEEPKQEDTSVARERLEQAKLKLSGVEK